MRPYSLLCWLLVSSSLVAQSADEKKAAIKFLASLQQDDGGFIAAPMDPKSDAAPRSTLRATSGAIRAIVYLGGEIPYPDKATAFVKSCYDSESGAFADTPGGKPDVVVTAVGIMATAALQKDARFDKSVRFMVKNAKSFEERRMAVAGMESAKTFDPVVTDWLAEIAKNRNKNGTYGQGPGQARETGGVVAMILRSGNALSDDQRKTVITQLQAGQRADGGFGKADAEGSDAETTYRVMRAFHLLKEKPKDVAKLKEFVARCRNADGGYGVTPGQPSTVSGTYFAAVIGYWLDK
jgi:prenyltransferase beta subunit